MDHELHAIYENGMLRLLEPLDLPEATKVIVTLREASGNPKLCVLSDPLLGLMADEAELLDEVVEAAMVARETHPLRAPE
jgi:predicted DNA-binding antitoxin AbrB/MazE fold protein